VRQLPAWPTSCPSLAWATPVAGGSSAYGRGARGAWQSRVCAVAHEPDPIQNWRVGCDRVQPCHEDARQTQLPGLPVRSCYLVDEAGDALDASYASR
jgi:hypothetical protein